MARIAELMNNKCYTLEQIADMAGFESKSTFNRFVKRMTGLPPRRYRELHIPSREP